MNKQNNFKFNAKVTPYACLRETYDTEMSVLGRHITFE